MPRPIVYSVPLNHDDTHEYVRIRRDIETVGARASSAVAYEFPNNESSRDFFRSVLGGSGAGLEPAIEAFLRGSGVREDVFENIICNMLEIDRAKRMGLVIGAHPIDIDHTAERQGGLGRDFIEAVRSEAKCEERLGEAIVGNLPFANVTVELKAQLIAHHELMRIRNIEMKNQIEALLGKEGGSLILMTGATHIPGISRMLSEDHVSVAQLEDPKAVSGIWWLAYSAMEEAKRLEGSAQIGQHINKYALLISINTLRSIRGSRTITDKETDAVRRVKTSQEAEKRYLEAQVYYRDQFESAIPILKRG